jgi:hypothetical protein
MGNLTLIKHIPEKQRKVFDGGTFIKKVWSNRSFLSVVTLAHRINSVFPNYVKDIGESAEGVYMDVIKLEGILISTLPHTDDLVKQVYHFCLDNMKSTAPFYHYDWALSNMIIHNNNITMCDWDNLNIYTEEDAMKKLNEDLLSAFGERYQRVIYD